MHDLIIVGGGPAGLTAAIYARRNGKSVLVIEKDVFGGQIVNSPQVENIPGFASISGDEFGDKMLEQAMGLGAEVTLEEVTGVEAGGGAGADGAAASGAGAASDAATAAQGGFIVRTDFGNAYEAKSVILATGTTHRTLGLDGEDDLIGGGISFCAVCDGDFYRDRDVVLIGGGNSAFVEAGLLAGITNKLVILQDLPYFTAEEAAQERVLSHESVETHTGVKVLSYETTDGELTGVTYEEEGVTQTAACDGVFLAVGLIPENSAFENVAGTDERGYFASGEDCRTNTPGLFVAGDCRAKTLRQVATACSDGAQAAIAACGYVDSLA